MTISTRTPEGWPTRCPVCGKAVCVEPSRPMLDATCPHCGTLLWLANKKRTSPLYAVAMSLGAGVLAVLVIFAIGRLIFRHSPSSTTLTLAIVGVLIFSKRLPELAVQLGNWMTSRRRE
jgi:uncharacterized paraquat-inducible protein A